MLTKTKARYQCPLCNKVSKGRGGAQRHRTVSHADQSALTNDQLDAMRVQVAKTYVPRSEAAYVARLPKQDSPEYAEMLKTGFDAYLLLKRLPTSHALQMLKSIQHAFENESKE